VATPNNVMVNSSVTLVGKHWPVSSKIAIVTYP
jgi:hypothetical protein